MQRACFSNIFGYYTQYTGCARPARCNRVIAENLSEAIHSFNHLMRKDAVMNDRPSVRCPLTSFLIPRARRGNRPTYLPPFAALSSRAFGRCGRTAGRVFKIGIAALGLPCLGSSKVQLSISWHELKQTTRRAAVSRSMIMEGQ